MLAKASPRALKGTFKAKLLELEVKPVMEALVRLREAPGVLGVSLAQRQPAHLRAGSGDGFSRNGRRQWPFPELQPAGQRWAEPDMEDVFTAYSQGYDAMLNKEAVR